MRNLVGLLLILIAAALPVAAQSTYGEIRGAVTDASGAVIASVAVTVTNKATGEVRKTVTDTVGNFSLPNMEAGTYDAEFEVSGFRKSVVQGVVLRAREVARVDRQMEVSSTTTEVQVVAARQVITTDVATVVDSRNNAQIQNLPVNFRAGGTNTIFASISLAPQVQPDAGGGSLSLAGAMPFMATASVDGISIINVRSNGILSEAFPSTDIIDELRVSSVSNSAEFWQAGDVTATSKSGTNALHGSAFWYHQNGAFDARDTFSVRAAPFKVSNDFGGTFSGPIKRNKAFFLGAYEGLRFRAQSSINTTVPPDSFRSGNLASSRNPVNDPLNNYQPFPGKILPANRISPVSSKTLERLYPRQSVAGEDISTFNYRLTLPAGNTNDQYDLRGDYNFSDRHQMFGRYSYKDIVRSSPFSLTTLGDSRTPETARSVSISDNFTIRPNLLNEFRFGITDRPRKVDFGPNGASFDGPALVKDLGIQGLRPDPPKVASVPDFGITGFAGTGTSRGFTQLSKTIQFLDNVIWNRGRHQIKAGFDVRWLRTTDNVSFFSGDDLGEYRFNGLFSGDAMADFLLGYPQRTRFANTGPDIDGDTWHQGYYVQDDWKVNSRLTLNMGIRWEYHPPFYDSTLQLANFDRDFAGGRVIVPNEKSLALTAPGFRASIGNTPIITAKEAGWPETLRFPDRNNWAPRVGFAWRPFGNKTVIRGGYGVYYVTILGSVFYSLVGIHTSDTRTFTNSRSASGPPVYTFPNPFGTGIGVVAAVGNADFRRGNELHAPDPYAQQWNFTIERDLGWNTGLRVTYTGSHSLKLFASPDLNQVRVNTAGYSVASRSRPYPNWAIVYSRDTGPSAKFNSMTVEMQKRFSHGLQFQSSWVWAKNLSNSTGSDGTGFAGENGSVPTDRFNLGIDYGNVGPTRRHRWLTTFYWDIPYGRGKPAGQGTEKLAQYIAGGWTLSGILLFQTGPYFTPITGGRTDPSATNVDSRANDRPDYAGTSYGNLDPSQRTLNVWMDRVAFTTTPSNIGRFGFAGPNALIGPGTQIVSTKLMKRLHIRETMYVQMEGSFQNALNHPNYAIPARNLAAANFGRITSTQGAEGAGARTIQVGMRLVF
ncbi:MAG: carboxypeptidase regulatory-like domain-containing protein [Acidobacteria bacterium]|nr:carboxypeptidase regulatory-like domain-containing protein [Acidobacteriota bacterium]